MSLGLTFGSIGLPGMHGRRRHITDPGVAVIVVVPGEEPLAEGTSMLDGAEARREIRLVPESLELRLGIRVGVAHVGPAVTLGDRQICKQQRHRLGTHRGARSACNVSWPGAIASLVQHLAISWWASSADGLLPRYNEYRSSIITSIPWEWGEYLNDHLGATAIIDRLLHRSHVIVIDGPSYREWAHRKEAESPSQK